MPNRPAMPIKLKATIVMPETAPPLNAIVRDSLKLVLAADAERALERTDVAMPIMPETAEEAAPRIKASAVCHPSSGLDENEYAAQIASAITAHMMAMVRY